MTLDVDAITIVEDDSPVGWHPVWITDKMRRRVRAEIRVSRFVHATMGRIPIVGRVMATFWCCLATEGVRSTCAPRWGAMTFTFLNDGYGATPWSVWQQMIHRGQHRYTGIWTEGAPRNRAEADAMLARWSGGR